MTIKHSTSEFLIIKYGLQVSFNLITDW